MLHLQIASSLGVSVRNLRRRLGISQEELAERADLHQTYIAGIEAGVRNPTLKSVDKLARALRISTIRLLLHASEPGDQRYGGVKPGAEHVDILMVEDNRDDVVMTLQAFKKARMTNSVQVVGDGREALDFLFCAGEFAHRNQEDRPQLVLLDLNLPKMSGVEVLRRIKKDERTRLIPVVILTASRDCNEMALCRRLGAEAFIVKPVDFVGLSQATPQLNLAWALLKPPDSTNLDYCKRASR